MNKVSKKQSKRNAEIARIKKELPDRCAIPFCYKHGSDLAHLLPKSTHPEYYTKKENLVRMCREHHNLYDTDIDFRQKQKHFFKQIASFDLKAAVKYFRL